MEHKPEDPMDPSTYSKEYRDRLLRKLGCLISVLKVATKKIEHSLETEEVDEERLGRIRHNLLETLSICRTAKDSLEKRRKLPEELRERLARVTNEPELNTVEFTDLPPGARTEMTSEAEHDRFQDLGPLDYSMIASCDFDELTAKLQE